MCVFGWLCRLPSRMSDDFLHMGGSSDDSKAGLGFPHYVTCQYIVRGPSLPYTEACGRSFHRRVRCGQIPTLNLQEWISMRSRGDNKKRPSFLIIDLVDCLDGIQVINHRAETMTASPASVANASSSRIVREM
ncbi:hypothetical protein AX14_006960 [Amanita brunnescens Koide BX004]|nr:hypothetical protein AX14_006960 [Amanita brunnescens Koide BX004]